jgi:hypothetical protein
LSSSRFLKVPIFNARSTALVRLNVVPIIFTELIDHYYECAWYKCVCWVFFFFVYSL